MCWDSYLEKYAVHLGRTVVMNNRYRYFCGCLALGRTCILSGGKKLFANMKEKESYSKAMPTEKYMAALPEF